MHLHESEWINQNNPEVPVTRAMLMIALQVWLLIVLKNNRKNDWLQRKKNDLIGFLKRSFLKRIRQ